MITWHVNATNRPREFLILRTVGEVERLSIDWRALGTPTRAVWWTQNPDVVGIAPDAVAGTVTSALVGELLPSQSFEPVTVTAYAADGSILGTAYIRIEIDLLIFYSGNSSGGFTVAPFPPGNSGGTGGLVNAHTSALRVVNALIVTPLANFPSPPNPPNVAQVYQFYRHADTNATSYPYPDLWPSGTSVLALSDYRLPAYTQTSDIATQLAAVGVFDGTVSFDLGAALLPADNLVSTIASSSLTGLTADQFATQLMTLYNGPSALATNVGTGITMTGIGDISTGNRPPPVAPIFLGPTNATFTTAPSNPATQSSLTLVNYTQPLVFNRIPAGQTTALHNKWYSVGNINFYHIRKATGATTTPIGNAEFQFPNSAPTDAIQARTLAPWGDLGATWTDFVSGYGSTFGFPSDRCVDATEIIYAILTVDGQNVNSDIPAYTFGREALLTGQWTGTTSPWDTHTYLMRADLQTIYTQAGESIPVAYQQTHTWCFGITP